MPADTGSDLVYESLRSWGSFGGVVSVLLAVIGILWRRDVAKDLDREALHRGRSDDAEARFQEVRALADTLGKSLERVSVSLATFAVAQEAGNDVSNKVADLVESRMQILNTLAKDVAVLVARMDALERSMSARAGP